MSTNTFLYLSELSDLFQDVPDVNIGNSAGFSGTGYELANLKTSDITLLWRSGSLTGSSTYIISIDLGSSLSWNLIAWINHTFPSASTITVKSGTTISVADHSDVMTWREFDMFFKAAATRTDRYIEIRLTSPSAWEASAGRLLVGLLTESAVPLSYGWSIEYIDKQSVNASKFNVKIVENFCSYKRLSLPLVKSANPRTTAGAAATLITFLKTLRGMTSWFFLIPYSLEYEGYVVRQMSTPSLVRDFTNEIGTIQVEEESRGERIGA